MRLKGGCSGSPRLAVAVRTLKQAVWCCTVWCCTCDSEAEQVDEWVNTQTLDKLHRAELQEVQLGHSWPGTT